MSIFTMGDLHLSIACNKPMDIFPGWKNYVEEITENWKSQVSDSDTVVLAGDISWGMTLQEAAADFEYIEALPGKKVILKGNHDYWWNSRRKMEAFFESRGLSTLSILHNSCVAVGDIAICGTRGWMLEDSTPHDQKVTAREEGRLKASLEAAKPTGLEPVVFLHYPPVFGNGISGGIIDLLREYGVKRCFYGHLHGAACAQAFEGKYLGIEFALVSADHLRFCLKRL
ncbi:metallophosphoesterase [Oscillospiraceae bacterium LTW-04]|nr:metallophosphoesterase [Oscillospiraceae bacterium MB24-C1]